MKFKALGLAVLAGIAVAMYAIPAFAHHSFAMFDGEKTVTLEGTIKEFQWTNPHAWILMMVPDAQGQPQQWALELPSPAGLVQRGWKPRMLTPGMNVTAVIHPLKDGQLGGAGLTFTLPDGKVMYSLTNGNAAAAAAAGGDGAQKAGRIRP